MIELDRVSIGRTLKRLRKQHGWSLENASEMVGTISASSLSSIERGHGNVSEEKIRDYCSLLQIEMEQLPRIIHSEDEQKEQYKRKLSRIEKMIDLIEIEKSHKKLKDIHISDDNELKMIYFYLEGRCFYHKRKYVKATDRFNQALQLLDKYPEMKYSNIQAACFNELGRIAFFYHNNLEQALQYVERGLESYTKNGMRKVIKLALLSSKASYLEIMYRDEEAMTTIEEIWKEQNQWYRSINVLLNAIEIKSNIYAKKQFYNEALEYAERGIELARSNKHFSKALELITVTGRICVEKQDYEEAKAWFLFGLELKGKIKEEYLFVSTYTHLGKLDMILGRWEDAKTNLHTAVELGEKNDDGIRYHGALIALGDYYIQTRQLSIASGFLKSALDLAERNQFPFVDSDLHLRLSHCYENSDPVLAKKHLDKHIASRLKFN